MRAKRSRAASRKGKSFLNVELDRRLRERLYLAARSEGKTVKAWLPLFLDEHLPNSRIVTTGSN